MSQPILLCVDDRPALLQVRKNTLEQRGYSVVTATDAAMAVTMLESHAVAALVLEYKSEGMDAEALAWLIKRRFPQTPIVLLSAYSDVPERVLWLVDEYVMRSEGLDGLVEVIGRFTGRPTEKKTLGAAA